MCYERPGFATRSAMVVNTILMLTEFFDDIDIQPSPARGFSASRYAHLRTSILHCCPVLLPHNGQSLLFCCLHQILACLLFHCNTEQLMVEHLRNNWLSSPVPEKKEMPLKSQCSINDQFSKAFKE